MKSLPTSGDKVTDALSRSALLAKADLLQYRRLHPAWVAAHSERGLASWIHDRQWDHLMALLTDVERVSIVDKEPVRDIYVGINCRVRVKRHHWDGKVSTYPTQAALDFMAQPPAQETLDGFQLVHLIAGYHWDKDMRDITAGVLSLRDGLDKQIWLIELPLPSDEGEGTPPVSEMPTPPTPKPPTIDTGALKEKGEEEEGEGKPV
jgi:hypothetical protein